MVATKKKKATPRKAAKKAVKKAPVIEAGGDEIREPLSVDEIAKLALVFALDAMKLDMAVVPHLEADFATLLDDAMRTDMWNADELRAHFIGLGNDLPVPDGRRQNFDELLLLEVFVCVARNLLKERREVAVAYEEAHKQRVIDEKSSKLKKARAKKRADKDARKKRAREQHKARAAAASA